MSTVLLWSCIIHHRELVHITESFSLQGGKIFWKRHIKFFMCNSLYVCKNAFLVPETEEKPYYLLKSLILLIAELTTDVTDLDENDYFCCNSWKINIFYTYFNFNRYFNFPKVLSCLLSHSSICWQIFKCLLCAGLGSRCWWYIGQLDFTHVPGKLYSHARKANSKQLNKQDVFGEW